MERGLNTPTWEESEKVKTVVISRGKKIEKLLTINGKQRSERGQEKEKGREGNGILWETLKMGTEHAYLFCY